MSRQNNKFIELAKSVANYHQVDWPLVKETFVKVGVIRLSVTAAVNAFPTGLTASARYVPRKGKSYQISGTTLPFLNLENSERK